MFECGGIGRAVVDDDYLETPERLGKNRIQRIGNIGSRIIGRNHDTDQHSRICTGALGYCRLVVFDVIHGVPITEPENFAGCRFRQVTNPEIVPDRRSDVARLCLCDGGVFRDAMLPVWYSAPGPCERTDRQCLILLFIR